jgi:hypothetical protein
LHSDSQPAGFADLYEFCGILPGLA